MTPEHEEHAVLLIPGWRSTTTGKLHIRRDCRAVQFHGHTMSPVLCRFDDTDEVRKLLADRDQLCGYCFPSGLSPS